MADKLTVDEILDDLAAASPDDPVFTVRSVEAPKTEQLRQFLRVSTLITLSSKDCPVRVTTCNDYGFKTLNFSQLELRS